MRKSSYSGAGAAKGSWIIRILIRSVLVAVPLLILYFLIQWFSPECWTCWDRGTVEGDIKCCKCNGSGEVVCTSCRGTGSIDVQCQTCKGSGRIKETVMCPTCKGWGFVDKPITCPACKGTGKVQEKIPCPFPSCRGSGKVKCRNCENGNGKCPTCKGSGEIGIFFKDPCPECHKGKNCIRCNGYGVEDCPKCLGSGVITVVKDCRYKGCNGSGKIFKRVDCPKFTIKDGPCNDRNCQGGIQKKQCGKCGGNGKEKCKECVGSGKVRGLVPCSKCKRGAKAINKRTPNFTIHAGQYVQQ